MPSEPAEERPKPAVPPLSRYVRPSYEDERSIEAQFDAVNFWSLYELTRNICLRKAPDVESIPPYDSSEARVIATLGATGLRKALEVVDRTAVMKEHRPWTEEELSEDSLQDYPNIEPVSRPDYLGHSTDINVLRHVEALGEALIDEGFEVLGQDAVRMAALFKDATTDEEQMRALFWLDERLSRMAYSNRGLRVEHYDEDSKMPHYHPARFSPKLLGRYPDHRLSPTCFGVSVVASGFMKRAGAEFMHAGVMVSAREAMYAGALMLAHGVPKLCTLLGYELSDDARGSLEGKQASLFEHLSVDHGTHGALLVRLQSGRWFQFDPAYHASVAAPKDTDELNDEEQGGGVNASIETAYRRLQDLANVAPSLEFAFEPRMMDISTAWPSYLRGLVPPSDIRSALHDILVRPESEATFEPIRKIIVDDWLMQPNLNEAFRDVWLEGAAEYQYGSETRPIDDAFYSVVNAHILRGDSLEEWMDRCRRDEHYRARVIEDVLCLPILIGVPLTIDAANKDMFFEMHAGFELGRPAMSLGFSALNDVAIYSGDPLSAHFWLSYWPNRGVVADKVALAERSRAQYAAVRSSLLDGGEALNYSRFHNIIQKFLDRPR